MRRFVGTLGRGMAFLALASCAPSSSGPPDGTGGSVAGTGGMTTAGTGGAVQPGTGGATGTGGASAGTGGNPGTGGASTGGNPGTGGASTGGNPGTGGASTGGNPGTGGAGGRGGGQGTGGATPNGGAGGAGGGEWMSLFNGTSLTGWTPSQGHAALFGVGMIDGGPAIHVYPTQADQSNQAQATLRTTQSFSSYTFSLEYKWGTKRFADRKANARDNGICFHICNDPAVVWPDSVELQIGATPWTGPGGTAGDNIDWVVGNIFMLVNRTRAQWPYKTVSGLQVYSATGTKRSLGAPTSYAKGMTDKQRNLDNAWNLVELTVHGSKDATYVVNGEVANGLTDMECQVNGTWQPLDRGPIALQAEFAEVYFRNIKIKILPP
jgi:hypothetical protein